MAWARLDDAFWSHPKVIAAGNEATGFYVRALSYSAGHGTAGRINNATATLLAGRRSSVLIRILLKVGLLHVAGDEWVIHDYDDPQYGNPTSTKAQQLSEAGKKAAQARWARRGEDQSEHADRIPDRSTNGMRIASGSHSESNADRNAIAMRPSRAQSRAGASPSPNPNPEGVVKFVDTPAVDRREASAATEPGVLPEIAKARRRAAGAHGVADVEGWSADECARICNTAAVKFAGGPAGPDDFAEARARLAVLAALPDTRGPQRLLEAGGWALAGQERERMAADRAKRQADAGALAEQRKRQAAADVERDERQRRVTTISHADPEHWLTLRQLARAELEAEDATPLGPVVDLRALQIHDRQTADQ